MPKQLVYESDKPGNLGVRKTVRTFNQVTGEPTTKPPIHVLFERQQTEPDLKGRFKVYGVATIGERFLEDNGVTFEEIHAIIMQPKFARVFGPIRCIVGPDTVLPKEVQEAEADSMVPEEKKAKAKK